MFAFERDFKMQRVFAQVFCAVNMQSTDPASVADLNLQPYSSSWRRIVSYYATV